MSRISNDIGLTLPDEKMKEIMSVATQEIFHPGSDSFKKCLINNGCYALSFTKFAVPNSLSISQGEVSRLTTVDMNHSQSTAACNPTGVNAFVSAHNYDSAVWIVTGVKPLLK